MEAYYSIKEYLEECKEPETYNFEFVCNDVTRKNLSQLSVYERYFIYKITNPDMKDSAYKTGANYAKQIQESGEYSGIADCDGSGADVKQKDTCYLAREVYRTLWNWEDVSEKNRADLEYRLQSHERYGKSCLSPKLLMGPDTMNSVQAIMDDIVKEIVAKEENKDLKEKLKGRVSIRYMIELYSTPECRKRLLEELGTVEWLERYIERYHTIGNFILVPAHFNVFRARMAREDWYESQAYLKMNAMIQNYKKHGIQWYDSLYQKYVNTFFLWDYVNLDGDAMEEINGNENSNKYSEYLLKRIYCIERRSYFMVAMLKLHQMLGEEGYQKLREDVFGECKKIYSGYEEVFKAIRDTLSDKITSNVNQLLSETKKKIGAIKLEEQ